MEDEILKEFQKDRNQYIDQLGKKIAGNFKSNLRRSGLQDDGPTIDKLQNAYIQRAQQISSMLNQYSTDLATHRQIIPQTRGVVKKVVYGN